MTRPDNDEQQPGEWGSNRFIIILAIIVMVVVVANFVTSWTGSDGSGQLQTPSGTSKDQAADSPPPG
jgi:flagellar basal body-associated protein FliL